MTSQQSADDTTTTDASTITRRRLLEAGGLLALLASPSAALAAADEEIAVGGGGADHGFRHGAWSVAPSTLPPEDLPAAWARRDALGTAGLVHDTVPNTWSASGLNWALAGDLATAKSNLSAYPAVALDTDGAASLLWEGSLPIQWTDSGVEHVIDSDYPSAKATHSGATPAVLWGASGSVGVIMDA
jgi:hypothetical protein